MAEATRAEGLHVVLVGMMGSGKTTVGRRLAAHLGRPFFDADEELALRTGRTVREWFENSGEDAFRQAETEVLHKLLAEPSAAVIAAGGGLVVREVNRRSLAEEAFVVWLRADPPFLAGRVQQKDHRPLIDGDVAATLSRLHAERAGWYDEVADAVIDVEPVHLSSASPKKELASMIADHLGRIAPAAVTLDRRVRR
ncbi:MAG: shikimate kinase [Acidimicrobiales bacterium]